ncbi:MAG: ACT domain-containing protein [SAR324 cluster bacterium]|nr:ACT domain-containing protein [SAR324 cluster bacterium]MBL7034993.1 ACT domain-containing protein [SAR324 cluster bacterium]
MSSSNLVLTVLKETYTIHKLERNTTLPEVLTECEFYSLSKTQQELSLVCSEQIFIQSENSSSDWKCLKVAGPLDFNLTGILAGLSDTLAKAKISIFAISTFNTDYILIQKQDLEAAQTALISQGYQFK